MTLVALVTGAGGGIGQSVAARLAREGAAVLATDLRLVTAPPGGATRVLDVCDPTDWRDATDEALDRWGRLDVLVNVAGVARAGHFVHLDPSEIDRHLDANLKGAALGMRTVLPHMLERKTGQVVNVGSLAGLAPVPGIALYSASKFALRGLSLAVAEELRGTGVAVSIVQPDLVDTAMIRPQVSQPEAAFSFSGKGLLRPDDVARAIARIVFARRVRSQEVLLPPGRGVLCKAVGAFPVLARAIAPTLRRRGLARQAKLLTRWSSA